MRGTTHCKDKSTKKRVEKDGCNGNESVREKKTENKSSVVLIVRIRENRSLHGFKSKTFEEE